MAGSLQDQLLGAGLIKEQKAKNIKTGKRKAEKQSRKTNTELENEAAKLAEEAREAQKKKSQALNEEQRKAKEQKEIAAQIRQIIQMNSIFKGKGEDLPAYNFTDFNKVKAIYVTAKNHDLIARGRIAIARLNDVYHLIPAEAAVKILERDEGSIVLLNDPKQNVDETVEDDPYAEFQIPDDLMW
jgi:uncharacterized protein YaiL (DUF2058 family)